MQAVVFTENNARIVCDPEELTKYDPSCVALNPDLMLVDGIPPEYWKKTPGGVEEMTPSEKEERKKILDLVETIPAGAVAVRLEQLQKHLVKSGLEYDQLLSELSETRANYEDKISKLTESHKEIIDRKVESICQMVENYELQLQKQRQASAEVNQKNDAIITELNSQAVALGQEIDRIKTEFSEKETDYLSTINTCVTRAELDHKHYKESISDIRLHHEAQIHTLKEIIGNYRTTARWIGYIALGVSSVYGAIHVLL